MDAVLLTRAEYERIESVLRVFGLSLQTTPDTAVKVAEALKLEGRAEASDVYQRTAAHLRTERDQWRVSAEDAHAEVNAAHRELDRLGVPGALSAAGPSTRVLPLSLALRVQVLAELHRADLRREDQAASKAHPVGSEPCHGPGQATAPSAPSAPKPVFKVGGYAACIHCGNTALGIDRACGQCGKHPFVRTSSERP